MCFNQRNLCKLHEHHNYRISFPLESRCHVFVFLLRMIHFDERQTLLTTLRVMVVIKASSNKVEKTRDWKRGIIEWIIYEEKMSSSHPLALSNATTTRSFIFYRKIVCGYKWALHIVRVYIWRSKGNDIVLLASSFSIKCVLHLT